MLLAALACFAAVLAAPVAGRCDRNGTDHVPAAAEPDMPMSKDPTFPVPVNARSLDLRDKVIWSQALARPDAETRRIAVEAIGQAAMAGAAGLEEFVPKLLALLDADHRPVVRMAAARALARMGVARCCAKVPRSCQG